jgi:hypothetical protein
MSLPWTTIYQLRNDREQIQSVQKASLTTTEFGLQSTHGLFGSAEWWQHVELGSLPTHTLRGVISRRWMGSMGDWPICEVTSDSGEKSEWTRLAGDEFYRVGDQIEIDYVVQLFKAAAARFNPNLENKVVLEVRVRRSS